MYRKSQQSTDCQRFKLVLPSPALALTTFLIYTEAQPL